jgi:hypothetical protein
MYRAGALAVYFTWAANSGKALPVSWKVGAGANFLIQPRPM